MPRRRRRSTSRAVLTRRWQGSASRSTAPSQRAAATRGSSTIGCIAGCILLAAAGCALRAHRGDARGAWSFAAAGVVVWGCAEIAFRLLAADPHAWYPQAAQVTAVRRLQPRLRDARSARARAGPSLRSGARARRFAGRPGGRGSRRAAAVSHVRVQGGARSRGTTGGVPARRPDRPCVRRDRRWHDRMEARSGVGPDRGCDHGERVRRCGARAPRQRGALSPRIAGRHAVRRLGAAARTRGLSSNPSRRRRARRRPSACRHRCSAPRSRSAC